MLEEWRSIVAGVVAPARPRLEPCLEEHRRFADALGDRFRVRTRNLADIERRLNAARARVFAKGDGVVPTEVTALEREWLAAARAPAPTRELDTLWRRVAPERWIASNRAAPTSAQAIVTLASDPDGIEEAERAAAMLPAVLAPFGVVIGPSVEWMVSREIMFTVRAEQLFSVAFDTLAGATHEAQQRAHRLRRNVGAELHDRKIETRNSSLGRELGWLAFASSLWAELRPEPAPFEPFATIYRRGYVPTAVDATGVTLTAVPVLP